MERRKCGPKQGYFKVDPAIDVEQAGRGEEPKPCKTSLWALKGPLRCVDSVWALGAEISAGFETWPLKCGGGGQGLNLD